MKRRDQQILTHTYILTYLKPSVPKELKTEFTIESVEEQYIPYIKVFKCQTYNITSIATEGTVMYRRDASFPEVRKIVDTYMKSHTYTNMVQKTNPISSNNRKRDKYRALIEQLVQLKRNDKPKFQEHLKRT